MTTKLAYNMLTARVRASPYKEKLKMDHDSCPVYRLRLTRAVPKGASSSFMSGGHHSPWG